MQLDLDRKFQLSSILLDFRVLAELTHHLQGYQLRGNANPQPLAGSS